MPEIASPTAAYIYTLSIDGPGLAWEYLRRNGGYRSDWSRFDPNAPNVRLAEPWGLRSPRGPDPRRSHRRAALAA